MKKVKKMFAVLMSVWLLQGTAFATNTSSGTSEEKPDLYTSMYKENKGPFKKELIVERNEEVNHEQLQTLPELDVEDTKAMNKTYAAISTIFYLIFITL